MKRLLFILAIAVGAVLGFSALPQSGSALTGTSEWPPLSPTCYDTNGDGRIDLFTDVAGVIDHYGTKWGDADYALLYDVSGGGTVDLFTDIAGVIDAYGTQCNLMDTQVVLATAGTMRYQNCDDALADGYNPPQGGIYVGNMGIHISKVANMSLPFYDGSPSNLALNPEDQQHQLTNPFGLVCTEKPGSPSGRPDKLIGVWYIIPTDATGPVYGLSGTFQPDDESPVGLGGSASDADNFDLNGVVNPDCTGLCNSGWHIHWNLCVGLQAGFLVELGENFPDAETFCLDAPPAGLGGDILINPYGWMLHMYNFIPNPLGRFMKWNYNPELQRYIP